MAEFETLADGYGLVEGPLPDGRGGVFFSDVVGGGMHHWSPDGVEVVVPKRRGIGGLAPHEGGGVVMSGRDLSVGEHVLCAAPEGGRGFNDIVTTDDGAILAGLMRFLPFAGEQPAPTELWRIEPNGTAAAWAEGFEWPNGIGLSPDGETVYASDYGTGDVRRIPVGGGRAELFTRVPEGEPDGLAVDAEGGVWVALGPAGTVAHFSPNGELGEQIDVPADFVASVAFDGEDLLVATAGKLLRTRVGISGRAVPPARAPV